MTDKELIEKLDSDEIKATDLSGSFADITVSFSDNTFVYSGGELYSEDLFLTDSYFIKYINKNDYNIITDDPDNLEESDFKKIDNEELRKAIARAIVRLTSGDDSMEIRFKDMPNYRDEYRKQMKGKEEKQQITERQLIETVSCTDSDKKIDLTGSSSSNGSNNAVSNNTTGVENIGQSNSISQVQNNLPKK